MAQAALDAAVRYAAGRTAFGQPLSGFQGVTHQLAGVATRVQAARLLVHAAATAHDTATAGTTQAAAMAKLFATELLGRVADAAVQIHGGMGYMKELWIERAYRDARIYRIYEGTSEIQRLVIASGLLADT